MRNKRKVRKDQVVATRLLNTEFEALKRVADRQKRTIGNMMRVLITDGVAALEVKEGGDAHAAQDQ